MRGKRILYKSVLSFCLAILLALQTVTFTASANQPEEPEFTAPESSVTESVYGDPEGALIMPLAAVPADKTAVFLGANPTFPLEVKQNNAVVAPNGTIQGRQPFTLKSEGLKVPVNGDDSNPTNANPNLYIQQGDWIELKRIELFHDVVLPTDTKTLMAQTETGSKKLGSVYFTPNSIKIVFDGDEGFFNGVGRAVTFGFETTANSDLTGLNYGESKPITIFGGVYQLKNPDVTAAYGITLTSPGMVKWDQYSYRGIQAAQLVEGAITWQSTVSAFDEFDRTIKLPLDGKKFFTDPASYNTGFGNVRGIYVPNSFKVNEIAVEPDIDANGKLSYIFPANTGVDPKVEFKTWIPKEAYYYEHRNPPSNLGRSYRDMLGKVELRHDSDKLAEAGQEISFAPDWIQASASYDHPNETITWTVVVNQYNKQGLNNFAITNVLPSGLEFISATWQTWTNNVPSAVQEITPDGNSVYSFGDIDGKVQLIIKSKVKSGSNFRIDPRANWKLDTPGGLQNNDVITGTRPNAVTDEAIVAIGAHAFTKGGSVSMEDFSLGGVTWTVSLTPQYALPNAVVYDVLVHGGNLNVLKNAVDATGEVSAETIAKIKAGVSNAQLWKQYHKGTLKSANALTLKAIPLTVNGEVVADLIQATGYTTDKAASFSFRALETNTDILFRQDINVEKARENRALLFDGEKVIPAENSVNLHLRMLNKDMLFASKPLKADGTLEDFKTNNINDYIRNDSNEAWTISAYDRTTKTVTFRLSVNMPGYNTEEMAKDGGSRVITNVKLVDTLPADWEFVPFSDGKAFELWKGSSSNGPGTEYGIRNDAISLIEPGTNAHVVSFSPNGNIGTFTFSKLESPYVILVKARPSNSALEKYLEEYTTNGTTKQVMYNKADLHMTWGGVEKTVTEQRKVIVPVQALGKSVTKPFKGVLEWTVNYYPPYNMENGVYLQDTIGAGMNLRKDGSGKLVLTAPSMAVYRAKLTASGALERDGAALNLSDPNSEVQAEAEPGDGGTTVLKFTLTDPNKFYQFVYQTEVDPSKARAGDKMGNEVKLMGDDKLKSVSARSESTLDSADVAGASSSNALLPLKKVDPYGNSLQGVEYTLYKKDSGAQAAKGTTDAGGKLNLLFPDPGYYELKETAIDPDTRLPITHVYQVYVGNTPGKPIWVDGVKVDSNNPLVVPTPATGKLTISNLVTGNGGDKNKDFTYRIVFDGVGKDGSYKTTLPDGTIGSIKSGDTFVLKDGQTLVIPKLIEGLTYTVTQDGYAGDNYVTAPNVYLYEGIVEKDGNHKADFVNDRTVNKLTIGNTVMGNGGDKNKEFEYTVVFDEVGKDGSYAYTKSDGTTNTPGTIKSGGTFKLKHGETLEIAGLPKDLKYTVTQNNYEDEEYVTTPKELNYSGVMTGKDEVARFTNVRVVKGGLLIGNTVKGKDDDKNKLFKYTITFTGEGATEFYSYEKSDGSISTIASGDTFELTDGQTFLVQGLPTYLQYKVTQNDYTEDGYVTDPVSLVRTGTIPEKTVAEARFVNTRPYLEGVLRDNNTGEVIRNASITVTDVKTGEKQTIQTDENGEYSVPAKADTDYTITYTKVYQVGGQDVPIEFTQKANVDGGVTDETVPADITAVGIVMFKQSDRTIALFDNSFTSHMYIYLKDENGNYIQENGHPKAFPMGPNGTFSVEGLSEQKYTMEVRYKADTGEELLFKVTQLDVKANGELNISEELVDPYGTVYDAIKGITTGQIEGAKVTLYYADTPRNRANGRIPGTKVTLPPVPNFPPHDNMSPEQDSDANGFYAYMVFPETDYYLIVTMPGYDTYTSPMISVDFDIVRHDVPMQPSSRGGNPPVDNLPGGNPPDGEDNETDGGNQPGGDNNGTDNGNQPGGDNNGTDNGNPPGGGDNGTDNGNPPDGNNGNGDGDGIDARPPEDDDLDDVPKTGDSGASSTFYMALALMALIGLRIAMPFRKKKIN
ncbi:DUF7601 domain-containing protein [Cohnella herbarum]|uniref:Uncharacterized protein n=1 Tax=Cohnella herbarum TaxID=2728023 RepID=A0A7Z2ZN92_9BACL|nr:carboxypeptidase regulatory-like domain-containing protein [Cohnella herbarum]QJD85610.1 hypothetical protein HH215_22110 [Cohnella herbarum]